jgi:thiol-disulfide isomerase/thioredoxin|nr:TlpA disulfide reductase family protein [Kofleriaceae bacterium]
MAPDQAKRGAITLDTTTLLVGGGVAMLGVAMLGAFMWMVPKGAADETKAACVGLRSQPPAPQACPGGKPCTLPVPAQDFTAIGHDGKPVHLSDYRGKVVLVNFWASWCNVCKTEKPALDAMAGDLSSDNFQVIALASDRSWIDVLYALVDALAPTFVMPETGSNATADEEMQAALQGYGQALPDGIPFEVLLDPPAGDGNIGKIAASWGIHAVPESALIDRKGNLRAYFVNKRDWESPVAETCLRSLIDEE